MRYELDPTCVLKFYISRLPQDRQNMGYDLDPTCVSKPHISRFPQNMQHGLDPTEINLAGIRLTYKPIFRSKCPAPNLTSFSTASTSSPSPRATFALETPHIALRPSRHQHHLHMSFSSASLSVLYPFPVLSSDPPERPGITSRTFLFSIVTSTPSHQYPHQNGLSQATS